MTRPSCSVGVANRHRHAIEQASRRWRGGRRDDSLPSELKILISTQVGMGYITGARRPQLGRRRVNACLAASLVLSRGRTGALGHHVFGAGTGVGMAVEQWVGRGDVNRGARRRRLDRLGRR